MLTTLDTDAAAVGPLDVIRLLTDTALGRTLTLGLLGLDTSDASDDATACACDVLDATADELIEMDALDITTLGEETATLTDDAMTDATALTEDDFTETLDTTLGGTLTDDARLGATLTLTDDGATLAAGDSVLIDDILVTLLDALLWARLDTILATLGTGLMLTEDAATLTDGAVLTAADNVLTEDTAGDKLLDVLLTTGVHGPRRSATKMATMPLFVADAESVIVTDPVEPAGVVGLFAFRIATALLIEAF
jgi:hypothetical protein